MSDTSTPLKTPTRIVACLCAEWCGTCRDYRPVLDAVVVGRPGTTVRWVDIEDEADIAGDIDVETFPTLLVIDDGVVRFYGPLLPQAGNLARLLDALSDAAGAAVAAPPEVLALAAVLGKA